MLIDFLVYSDVAKRLIPLILLHVRSTTTAACWFWRCMLYAKLSHSERLTKAIILHHSWQCMCSTVTYNTDLKLLSYKSNEIWHLGIYLLDEACMKLEDGWERDVNCDTGGENIYNIIRYSRISKQSKTDTKRSPSLIQYTPYRNYS